MKASLFDRIHVSGKLVSIPDEDLEDGISAGTPFPPSYKAFIRRFGYGRTCGRFIIHPPMGNYPDSFHERSSALKCMLMKLIEEGDGLPWQLEPDGSTELLKGSTPFATSENGETLFWDPARPDGHGEFPIYIDGPGAGIRLVGNGIETMLAALSDESGYKSYLPFDASPLPLLFESFGAEEWIRWRHRAG